MSYLEDFHERDRVKHSNLGPGVVISRSNDSVICAFDDRFKTVGNYDRAWFRINPGVLLKVMRP
jgi:hypothetical protein